jgi:LytS/YehU family sensor histidine kinase
MNAAKYISSFAKLMRKSLEHSRVDFVRISDEVELVDNYLFLEQLRFKNKFTYKFNIHEAINRNKIQIPSMILQPFIENSIKHGLISKEGNEGVVSVNLKFEGELLKCEIDDNGVGRNVKTAGLHNKTEHTSHGIDITVERLKMYCKNEKTKFYFEMEDKSGDSGSPTGLRVIFYLPYKIITDET